MRLQISLRLLRGPVFVLLFAIVWGEIGIAQDKAQFIGCVESAMERDKKGPKPLGIQASEAENVIRKVAKSIGLSSGVKVVPCQFGKVSAFYINTDDATDLAPEGEYITYNEDWVREVIGRDRVQLVALLGHEFGHFINRHFEANRKIPRDQQEIQADHFAGCAVARNGGQWSALENLLGRLRQEHDPFYPNRLKSLSAASDGFKQCGGTRDPAAQAPLSVKATAFCPNIKILLGLAEDGYQKLWTGESGDRSGPASFRLPGFDRCRIANSVFPEYLCYSSYSENLDKEFDRQKTLSVQAKKCLDPSWVESKSTKSGIDTIKGTITYRDMSSEKFVQVTVAEIPALITGMTRQYYTTFSVGSYKKVEFGDAPANAPITPVKAEKPDGYCEQLKSVIATAKDGFSSILGRVTTISTMSKTQLPGWSDCRIYANTSGKKYYSCSLPQEQDKKSAEIFIQEMKADIIQCLGAGWTSRLRKNYKNLVSFEATSIDEGTEVELRMSDRDNLWVVKIDVNQSD